MSGVDPKPQVFTDEQLESATESVSAHREDSVEQESEQVSHGASAQMSVDNTSEASTVVSGNVIGDNSQLNINSNNTIINIDPNSIAAFFRCVMQALHGHFPSYVDSCENKQDLSMSSLAPKGRAEMLEHSRDITEKVQESEGWAVDCGSTRSNVEISASVDVATSRDYSLEEMDFISSDAAPESPALSADTSWSSLDRQVAEIGESSPEYQGEATL